MLVVLVDYLHLNVDKAYASLLLFLGLSKAFDTVKCASLLRHLEAEVGIKG